MTPLEILQTYGVDVSCFPADAVYRVATSDDMWLQASGAYTITVGDLLIIMSYDYRSRIYAHKLLSRCVDIAGPDNFIYVYHKIFAIGKLANIVDQVLRHWETYGISGAMSFTISDKGYNQDGSSKGLFTRIINIEYSNGNTIAATKLLGVDLSLIQTDISAVVADYGDATVVQYHRSENNGLINYGYTSD